MIKTLITVAALALTGLLSAPRAEAGRILLLEPSAPVAGTDAVVSGLRSEYFKRCGSVGRSSPYIEPSRNGVT